MRIIAGKYKGRHLKAHYSKSELRIRPTSDRVREAIFSMLQDAIENATVCDLFAGSGAIGIEALSRGCRFCTFVESYRKLSNGISENLGILEVSRSDYEVFTMPVDRFLRYTKHIYNIIFMDPPYGKNLAAPTLSGIFEKKLLAPSGKIVIEHEAKKKLTIFSMKDLDLFKEKVYGETQISIFILKGDSKE